jgi:hypothetical protein
MVADICRVATRQPWLSQVWPCPNLLPLGRRSSRSEKVQKSSVYPQTTLQYCYLRKGDIHPSDQHVVARRRPEDFDLG